MLGNYVDTHLTHNDAVWLVTMGMVILAALGNTIPDAHLMLMLNIIWLWK